MEILITKEVARKLRVSEEFVRLLIRQKKLRAYQEGRRGGYRILQKDVDKYIKMKLKKI
ncbi:MAG: helix-turn-helix domain-containing protein [Candidatus Omnitrophota bacterium]